MEGSFLLKALLPHIPQWKDWENQLGDIFFCWNADLEMYYKPQPNSSILDQNEFGSQSRHSGFEEWKSE